MIRFYIFLTVVLVSLTVQIEGQCFADHLKTVAFHDASGHNSAKNVCEYLNKTHDIGDQWSYNFPDCLNCQCSKFGLSCCGYGVKAGIFFFPESCQLAKNTCEVKLVKKSDPTKPCFDDTTTKSSTSTVAPKKKKKHSRKHKNNT